jgi:hypothetical protein
MSNVPPAERPTLVSGLRRSIASHARKLGFKGEATERTEPESNRHAVCVFCGASSPDWRGLLSCGAVLVAHPDDASRQLLSFPFACGACGGSDLELLAPRT